MNNQDWDDTNDFLEEDVLMQANKSKGSSRKRKWREIETIKEQRRLKREIAEYSQYLF